MARDFRRSSAPIEPDRQNQSNKDAGKIRSPGPPRKSAATPTPTPGAGQSPRGGLPGPRPRRKATPTPRTRMGRERGCRTHGGTSKMMALRTEHKIFYSGKDFHHRKLFLLTAALGFSTVKTMTNWERHPRMTVDREKGCWLLPVNIHNGYPAAENLNGRRWTRVCEVLWEQKNGKKP